MLLYYYKCEQKKFLYQKWNIIVLFGILLLVPVMVLTLGSYAGETGKLLSKSKLIQGFYLGQAGYTVLTALYFGNEYILAILFHALSAILPYSSAVSFAESS